MDAPQLVLLAVGGLLLAGGTTGIVVFGGEGAEALYAIRFQTVTEDLPLEDDAWSSSGAVAFRVTRLNVTEVRVAVTCNDPSPVTAVNPATVTVTVTGPNGFEGEASGACGSTVTVPVDTGDAPADTTSLGTSPEDAVENLPASFTLTNATGEWRVGVESARAQNPLGQGTPNGTISVEVTSYSASAQAAAVR